MSVFYRLETKAALLLILMTLWNLLTVAPYCINSGFNAVAEAYYNESDLDFIFITEKYLEIFLMENLLSLLGKRYFS